MYSRKQAPATSCPVPISTSSLVPTATNLNLPIAFRKGKHQCTYPISSFVSYDHLSPSLFSFVAFIDSITTPKTVHEALSHPGWSDAMMEEMNALDANGTWSSVNLPT